MKFSQIIIPLTAFLFLVNVCNGQVMDSDMGVLESTHLPGFVKEKKPDVESPFSKNYFLSNSWQMGSIKLQNDQVIDNVFIKYDVVRHILEFKEGESIYMLSGKSVDSFYWIDPDNGVLKQFDPVIGYYNFEEAMFGFFEVVDQHTENYDEYKLLVYHSVWMYPATSSVSLSGSHKQNDIYWKEDYYLAENGELKKFDKKKKNNYQLFGQYQEQMKHYIRKKGLGFRNREDQQEVFDQFIQLISSGSN